MYLERPEGMTLADAEGFAAQPGVQPLASIGRPVAAVPESWRTVGHLYRGIEAGLARLCGRYGEEAVFIGPPAAQAVTATFEWKELAAVTSLASASRAIELIVEQGEGARGDWVNSHFGKFTGILEDLLAMQAADPGFDPARPVEPAYVRLPPDVASGILIEDLLTARVADLCKGLYEVMLQVLSRYYVHHGETPAELETLARTAKHLMNWVMRPLGSVLTTLPIGPSHPGRTAGPALEITRPAYFVLPHREPAWKIITERLDVLTKTCTALAREPGLSALGDLAAKLRSMHRDVRKHLDERASVAPGSA
jgi:hypothetical protein